MSADIKGGSARRPTDADAVRLRKVASRYGARDVLLADWKRGRQPTFYALRRGTWVRIEDPGTIFR
jgi:hypothetical protein